jgi:hypothetical protein
MKYVFIQKASLANRFQRNNLLILKQARTDVVYPIK